jgi:serine/threonine-protein kinase
MVRSRQTPFEEHNGEISPDGRWIAYQSNESGTDQIYVRPFPNVNDGHWQISTAGGFTPAWARSGRELFYVTPAALMSVAVHTTETMFAAESPAKIFETAAYLLGIAARTYDVAPDGQRFLVIKPSQTAQDRAASSPSLTVVEHWTGELKQRVPVK